MMAWLMTKGKVIMSRMQTMDNPQPNSINISFFIDGEGSETVREGVVN
jgi:hypothetical protein